MALHLGASACHAPQAFEQYCRGNDRQHTKKSHCAHNKTHSTLRLPPAWAQLKNVAAGRFRSGSAAGLHSEAMFRLTAVLVLLPLVAVVVPLVFLAAWVREAMSDLRMRIRTAGPEAPQPGLVEQKLIKV
jgi:hypothetical protein